MSTREPVLTVTSPVQTFAEPITPAEVRSWIELAQIDVPDSERELLLIDLIASARHQIEIAEDTDLVRKQLDLSLASFYCDAIRLGRGPLISVDIVRYRDSDGAYTTLVEDTDYIVVLGKPGYIRPPYGMTWPSYTSWPSEDAVLIRYMSGYLSTDAFWNDAGKDSKLAMRYLISTWFSNRLAFSEDTRGVVENLFTVSHLARGVPRVG
jgi:uncharacterized phiE125 gp8 family phage protein